MSSYAVENISARLRDAVVEKYRDRTGASWAVIRPAHIIQVTQLLKFDLGFRNFLSMDAVDRLHLPDFDPSVRFEVLYFLRHVERKEVVRLKVRVAENEEIPTITGVYQGAAWAERFVWDFYGVVFTGGLKRRMMMYPEFEGHALRKDYPLRGRQSLLPERPITDIVRGPGTNGPVHSEGEA